jgi:hypothetical protein
MQEILRDLGCGGPVLRASAPAVPAFGMVDELARGAVGDRAESPRRAGTERWADLARRPDLARSPDLAQHLYLQHNTYR